MTDEHFLRFGLFAGALGVMLLWESWRPFRIGPERKIRRLARHLFLMALNLVCLRLVSGGGAYAVAVLAEERHWGWFQLYALPAWLAAAAAFLLLDFAIYAQHVVFHKVPVLWRLHRVHHCDVDFDTTTAIRFHPLEIVLSMFYKMVLVLLFGIAPEVVLAFEAILNAAAQFNHGNVRLPAHWEGPARWLLITPDMHRIHHSSFRAETDSNFGFSVPWWDRLCGTYCASPHLGQEGMEIGLTEERRRLGLGALLRLPFRTPDKA